MKKKVGLVLPIRGKGGGPYTSTINISKSTLNKKYNFVFIYYDINIKSRFPISYRLIQDVKKQIEVSDLDLLHFSGLSLMGVNIAIAAALSSKKTNTLLTIRGSSSEALDIGVIKKIILGYMLEPITLAMVDNFICVSNYVCNKLWISRFFKRKRLGTIYNYPPSIPNKEESGFSIREELNINKEDIIVVTVGRITKDKGYHILTEVISKFNKNDHIKFLIIGEGNYLSEMKGNLSLQHFNKQFFTLGYRNDILNILKESDIFVLPTLHETLSNALLEASVMGLPMVASKTGGIPEIIKDNYNGYLINPGDIDGFFNKILFLAEDEEARIRLGDNSIDNIKINFSKELIDASLEKVYNKVIS